MLLEKASRLYPINMNSKPQKLWSLLVLFVGSAGLPFTHIAGYVSSALALPELFAKRFWSARKQILAPLVLLLLYWTIRALFTAQRGLGLLSALNMFANTLLPFAAGAVASRISRSAVLKIYAAATGAIVAAGVLAAAGILPRAPLGQRLWDEGILWGFHHHNDLAGNLILCLPATFALGGAWRPVALPILVGFVLTGSRGYLIAFPVVVVGVVATVYRSRRGMLLAAAAIALAAAATLALPGTRARVKKTFAEDGAVIARINLLRMTTWALSENPVFGIGPGQLWARTDYVARARREGMFIDAKSGHIKHLHNAYATVLAEGGFVALALFAWTLFAVCKALLRGDRLAKALGWGVIGFLVGNLFDAQLLGPSGAMDLFFLAGTTTKPKTQKEKWREKSTKTSSSSGSQASSTTGRAR